MMKTGHRTLHLLLFLGGLLSAPSTLKAQSPRVVDSAGVRIVIHGVIPNSPAPLRLATAYSIDLGGLRENPSEEISSRNPFLIGRPLSNGRWAVVDMSQVRILGSNGQLLESIGRAGQGPGEFRQIRNICIIPGDTIVVLGFGDRRIGAFEATGKHIHTSTLNGEVDSEPCFADGSILVRGDAVASPSSHLAPQQAFLLDRVAPVQQVRWDGKIIQSLGLMQVGSLDFTFEDYANIVPAHNMIYVGNGSEPEYRVYDEGGALKQVVRWRAASRAVTPAMRAARVNRGFLAGPAQRSHLPHYSALRVDPTGSVWLKDYESPPGAPVGYTVFGANGELIGRVSLPLLPGVRAEVVWLGADRALVAWRDADGAPRLTVHPIMRQ